MEVRFFENIYGPLYEDTRRIVLLLDDYAPSLTMKNWPGIRASRFGAFLEPALFASLDELRENLQPVENAARVGREGAALIIRNLLDKIPAFADSSTDARRSVAEQLVSDHHLVFDPNRPSPNEDILRGIGTTLGGRTANDESIRALVSTVKGYLELDVRISDFRRLRGEVLERAKVIHADVQKRMQSRLGSEPNFPGLELRD